MKIEHRNRVLVNIDPQRRCYNGCHASSKLQWTKWEVLESNINLTNIEARLIFWYGLSDYAVAARGESARSEYRSSN